MVRAIIFDCFGVLVGRGFDETYRSVGGDPNKDYDFIRRMLGRTNLGLISPTEFREEMIHHLGITENAWREALKRAEQPDYDLLGYIESLHKSFKTAILSNANKGVVQRKLGEEWLQKCFDTVIISAEVGRVKPDPEIYLRAAHQLEVELSECIFIDDLDYYVRAAEAVGMKGILFHNVDQMKSDLHQILKMTR